MAGDFRTQDARTQRVRLAANDPDADDAGMIWFFMILFLQTQEKVLLSTENTGKSGNADDADNANEHWFLKKSPCGEKRIKTQRLQDTRKSPDGEGNGNADDADFTDKRWFFYSNPQDSNLPHSKGIRLSAKKKLKHQDTMPQRARLTAKKIKGHKGFALRRKKTISTG